MATGLGRVGVSSAFAMRTNRKTYTAVNFVYRLIKLAGARPVLFLVDRGNFGDQTLVPPSGDQQASSRPTTAASSPNFTTSSTCNPRSSTASAASASPPSSAFTPCYILYSFGLKH
jgi:hypothetical protein